jgi:hypothetical protein
MASYGLAQRLQRFAELRGKLAAVLLDARLPFGRRSEPAEFFQQEGEMPDL